MSGVADTRTNQEITALQDKMKQAEATIAAIEAKLTALKAAFVAINPTNVTPDSAYDANATTVDEIADVFGTFIASGETALT